jgi:beta-glucosidase-like glycosyl hydrolase
VDKVHAIIKKLVSTGEIKPERIEESFQRILQLKARMGNRDVASYKAEIVKLQNQIKVQAETPVETPQSVAPVESTRKKKKSKKN